jgi:hypothetical protein
VVVFALLRHASRVLLEGTRWQRRKLRRGAGRAGMLDWWNLMCSDARLL